MYSYVLFPGRHHVLTRFQASYLKGLLGTRVASDATVIWAVTSANHQTTKRNPVPFDRREAAIERLSVLEDLRSLVVGVVDTPPTDDFESSPTASRRSRPSPTRSPANRSTGRTPTCCWSPAAPADPSRQCRPGAPVGRPAG